MQSNYELADNTLLLKGTITVNTAGNLLADIKKILASETGLKKIDCSQVELVDSAVISLLLSCLREVKRIDRKIDIVGMGDKLSELAVLYEVREILKR